MSLIKISVSEKAILIIILKKMSLKTKKVIQIKMEINK